MRRLTLAVLATATMLATPSMVLAADLTIGLAASPTSMDPQFYVVGPNSAMARNIFDGLVNQDEAQRIQPALAISWKLVDDTTWEFKLRPGVKFHDGSDFTAADVVASIHRVPLAAKNSPSSFVPYVKGIASVEAVDPLTVRIKTKTPDALLLNNLSRIAILPAAEEKVPSGDLNGGKGVIGTGPFKFVSWSPQNNVVLQRNPDYWGEPAAWDKVTFRTYTDPSARVAAILAGDVDMIESVPTADVGTLKKKDWLQVVSAPSNRVMYLHPDQDRDVSPFAKGPDGSNPLRKPEVRRAMSLALNRQALVDKIMDGEGAPAGQLVPEGYFGYAPALKPDPYDPGRAKQLLAEAGYPKGFQLTFHATNDRYPNDSLVAQAIGQLFTRVGIQTKIETLPGSVYFSRASKREFSLIMGGAAVETGEASGVLGPLLETYGPGAGQGNRGRYSSPEFDAALREARATVDDARRSELLQKAATISMNDLGVIPLFFLSNVWSLKAGLHFGGRTDGYTLAYDVKPGPQAEAK
ncbi:peptide/nickel transport system substrate-binding protein [Faunimonas pinastri]|uniref:Peptide/nickel transport system substrate-binding protein n=1 Tax=Faunimonas pinastri TaxID=1855383 RepID=A0A1H9LAL9_9HYPH|nr:ABC transporter substrate-binding protein [Faunimonas pinastri]SER08551.1 peptide/nickel transport system substrate-binding protein [Faunimonas pinastri]